MEPRLGFEPRTPSLPWKCSTTELSRRTSVNCTKCQPKCQVAQLKRLHKKERPQKWDAPLDDKALLVNIVIEGYLCS